MSSVFRLNRSIVRVQGQGVAAFLQGLVTQDVVGGAQSSFQKLSSLGTLFLNPKGRIISDAILTFPTDQSSPTILIDVPDENRDIIANMLIRHKLRLPLTIDKMEDLVVCGNLQTCNDPRSPEVCGREILNNSSGRIVDDSKLFQEYSKRRLIACIPEGLDEIPRDSIVPIFYNFDLFKCISFTKGCYTGQELVTRTIRRGVVRKRLFPIKCDDGEEVTKGAEIWYKDLKIGEVISGVSNVGLSLLTLAEPLNEKSQIQSALKKLDNDSISLQTASGDCRRVEIIVPHYMR